MWIVEAVIVGLIVGFIARLAVPGKHPTGLIVTAVIGIAGSVIATVAEQLAALGRLDVRFTDEGLDYWVFGGWAVDLHAGEVTRVHDDIDVAVWAADAGRVARALELDGWTTVPERLPGRRARSGTTSRPSAAFALA